MEQAKQPLVEQLLDELDRAFNRKSWHGTNLRGALRGIDLETATWRPHRDRHNIWEIVVHAAYWKYIVRRRLLAEKRGSFPLKGSNWFPRPQQGRSWREDVNLLTQTHRRLRSAVSGLRDRDLSIIPKGSRVSNLEIISGIAAHDLYHAGQIQLLKKLASNF